jgi:cell division protein FtsI/penicillin-binding protein 2
MENFKPNPQKIMLLLLVMTLIATAMTIKIFKVQFIGASDFTERANRQYGRPNEIISPNRGEIFDRNGIPLAVNVLTYDLACEPVKIKNSKGIADIVSKFTGISLETVNNRLGGKNGTKNYTRIKQDIGTEVARKLKEFNLKGIIIEDRYKRSYPEQFVASPLIGFTGADSQGLSGMEIDLEKKLAGEKGIKTYPIDAESGIAGSSYVITKPVIHGTNIYLSIDSTMQFMAEQELERTCKEWNAKGGCVIVMDPSTGELLALAQTPMFDCNKGNETPINARNNRPLAYIYEPGSVAKGIITAIGLEKKVINDDSEFFCAGGTVIDKQHLRCVGTHSKQKLTEALRNSCNMAFIEVGKKIGPDLFKYFKEFGFGKKPGTGLYEESGFMLSPEKWSKTTLATMSYGQGVSMSPLQLCTAYSALANGGVLMKPILLRQTYDPNKGTFEKNSPQPIRQVVSKETADHTLSLLTSIVSPKGIKEAIIKGYSIAGKTGTSPKTFAKGGYDWSQFNCSFCGIVPTDKDAPQKVVIFVTVDSPNKPGVVPFGSTVAAPCFRRVAENVLSALRITPKEVK